MGSGPKLYWSGRWMDERWGWMYWGRGLIGSSSTQASGHPHSRDLPPCYSCKRAWDWEFRCHLCAHLVKLSLANVLNAPYNQCEWVEKPTAFFALAFLLCMALPNLSEGMREQRQIFPPLPRTKRDILSPVHEFACCPHSGGNLIIPLIVFEPPYRLAAHTRILYLFNWKALFC